jgi:hypothetical protein
MIEWKEFGDRMQYRVSSDGMVQTRTNGTSPKLRSEWREKKVTFKKSDYTGCGYLITGTKEGGKFKSEYVHRIVAKNFLPNNSAKAQVNHIDGNRLNNKLKNLEWSTPLENMRNSVERGSHEGKGSFKGKLCEYSVLTIATLINAGWRNKEIALHYNVDQSNISKFRSKVEIYKGMHNLLTPIIDRPHTIKDKEDV